MRDVRRSQFVSAAQVAYHYSYKLDEAMVLSVAQRRLLIDVVKSEERRFWDKLEATLGTSWDVASLIEEAPQGPQGPLPDTVHMPLVPFIAAEAFKSFVESVKTRAKKSTVDVGTLDVDSAKDFFKGI